MLVIFDFDFMENQSLAATNLRPYDEYEGENTIPEMPWLDIEVAHCNCSCYLVQGKIGVNSQSSPSQVESDSSESCESDSSVSSQEDTSSDDTETQHNSGDPTVESESMYTEYFKLKGSTFQCLAHSRTWLHSWRGN